MAALLLLLLASALAVLGVLLTGTGQLVAYAGSLFCAGLSVLEIWEERRERGR